MNVAPKKFKRIRLVDFLVLILSVYVIIAIAIEAFFEIDHEVLRLLLYIDDAICVFFLIEFSVRFYRANNKLEFMKWGWIDLVSSIPSFAWMRPGRAISLFRVIRVLRAFRSTKHIIHYVFTNRIRGTFTFVAVIAILTTILASIFILEVEENAPGSNIKTAEDAIWWSYVTITTVGYGDKYPVTTEGRIIAAVLMTVGVGLLGTFTGFLASWFVQEEKVEEIAEEIQEDKDKAQLQNDEEGLH